MAVMAMFRPGWQNVSPEAHSTPNRATMSPGPASVISDIASACMRTRRPTLIFWPERELTSSSPLRRLPW